MEKKVYLNISHNNKCDTVHVVEKGDTLYSIAQKYHTRVRILLALNPFVDIYNLMPGDEICVPGSEKPDKEKYKTYIVKKGDTLGSILKENKVTFVELAKRNKVLYDIPVTPGIILFLPNSTEKKEENSTDGLTKTN